MALVLTFHVNNVKNKNEHNFFGKWFGGIIDSTGLKKVAIAKKAEIRDVSLSRILSGAHGVARDTAVSLVNAINDLAGREVADMDTAIRLALGYEPTDSEEISSLMSQVKDLTPRNQKLVTNMFRRLLEEVSLSESDLYTEERPTYEAKSAPRKVLMVPDDRMPEHLPEGTEKTLDQIKARVKKKDAPKD